MDPDKVVQGTGQLVITSSMPSQRSWESSRYKGSVFTKHLIDGLRKDGVNTNLVKPSTIWNLKYKEKF
ncbi:MAG: hypothetical protein R3D26_11600 [Cyanobacteriota/Melainabacteria group bacterium]